MDHDFLLHALQAPSVTLIRAENAALILSFLYQEFKLDPRPIRPLDGLIENLARYLDRLSNHYPDRYKDSAKNYIAHWSEGRGWLRIYRQGNSPDYIVELTTYAQQALSWAAELQPREFLGTESRFAQILALLNEIVMRSSSDPQVRIAQLSNEKTKIEREIARIESSGRVEGLSGSQIRERFQLATEQAEHLLRDFTAVEERFREIAQLVQQEQNKPDTRKGEIVGKMLDADEQLRESEVGRSFYAFWDYLQHPERKDALYILLDQVIRTDPIDATTPHAALLREMPRYLIDAGLKVDQTNHRLAEQLRRLLDETYAAESRRIRALIGEVKALFSEYADIIELGRNELGATIETLPRTQLVMARGVWSAKEEAVFTVSATPAFNEDEFDAEIASLVNQFYLDEGRIRNRIERALDAQPEVSLRDLLLVYPVEQGLAEILAYIQYADHQDDIHLIDERHPDEIFVRAARGDNEDWLRLYLPHIVFRRVQHGQR